MPTRRASTPRRPVFRRNRLLSGRRCSRRGCPDAPFSRSPCLENHASSPAPVGVAGFESAPSFRGQTTATGPTARSFMSGLPIDAHHSALFQVVAFSLAGRKSAEAEPLRRLTALLCSLARGRRGRLREDLLYTSLAKPSRVSTHLNKNHVLRLVVVPFAYGSWIE
jgi:hypothetical protein